MTIARLHAVTRARDALEAAVAAVVVAVVVVVVVAGSLVLAMAAVLNQPVAKEPLLVLESTAVAEVSKCNTMIGVLHQWP